MIIIVLSKRYSDSFLTKKSNSLVKLKRIKMLIIFNSILLIAIYICFTFSAYAYNNFSFYIQLSSIPLILAILQYLKMTLINNETSDPSLFIIKDKIFLFLSLIWLTNFLISKS